LSTIPQSRRCMRWAMSWPGAAHKFDLAHMRVLLAALGHPEKNFQSVLIAGTNGKGSTAARWLPSASIGLKTGFYTSPHLDRINERIRIDGQPIEETPLPCFTM